MKCGDVVQVVEPISDGKRKVCAFSLELVTIINVDHSPVLIVEHFDTKEKFPVLPHELTTELHPKNIARLKKNSK